MSAGWRAASFAMVVVTLLSACNGSPPRPVPVSPPPATGGALQIGVDALEVAETLDDRRPPRPPFEVALDPLFTSTTLFDLELLRCCIHRTLFSYSGLPVEQGGGELQPDLAVGMPEVSNNGRTWTVRIQPGLRYAPPFANVEITSHDFVRALTRIFTPIDFRDSNGVAWDQATDAGDRPWPLIGGWWAGPFGDIEGTGAFSSGAAQTIAGVATPDERTIVFNLSGPIGDFAERLAMTALSPIPPGAWERTDPMANYAPFQVSTGPYMIAGLDNVDYSRPARDREPPIGWVRGQEIRLVRNPSWDHARDLLRWALVDEIRIVSMAPKDVPGDELEAYADQLVAEFAAGSVDLMPDGIVQWRWEELAPVAHTTDAVDRLSIQYLYFNLARPPFDDVEVRRSVAYAFDRGGRTPLDTPFARPAYRLSPDLVTGGLLTDYDPYATAGNRGDVELALAAMRRATRYDTDGDGLCDVPACSDILFVSPWSDEDHAGVVDELGAVGIEIEAVDFDKARELSMDPFSGDPGQYPAIWSGGFLGDYPSGTNFLGQQFGGGPSVHPSLIGSTPQQLADWGYSVTDVPTVADLVEDCSSRIGSDGRTCWARFEQYLMEEIVPAVPVVQHRSIYVASSRITQFYLDPTLSAPTFDKIAMESP